MLNQLIKKPLIYNKNIYRTYVSQKDFIPLIKNFTKHNIKYIYCLELKIFNPDKLNMFNPTIYEGNIWFIKNNLRIYSKFNNNDIEQMFN